MPVCPECGLDVEKEGLCPECQKASQTRTEGKKKNLLLPIVIIGGLIIAAVVFVLIFFKTSPMDLSLTREGEPIEIAESSSSEGEGSTPDTDSVESIEKTGENPEGVEIKELEEMEISEEPEKLIPAFDLLSRTEHPPIGLDQEEEYIKWMLEHTVEKEEFLRKRWERGTIARHHFNPPDLKLPRIIEGFLRTPRENFCREYNLARAYDHAYLSIGYGQTISGPHIVCRMTDFLNPQPHHKVLEIGTGSGYQSAFLAELSNFVYTIEIVKELAEITDGIYKHLEADYPEYKNVKRKIGDGYYGWEEYAPFDRIIVTCGIDHIPPPLLAQLAPGGMMVIPVGPPSGQTILKVTKTIDEDGTVLLAREDIYKGTPVTTDIFVPFTAEGGGVHSKAKDID